MCAHAGIRALLIGSICLSSLFFSEVSAADSRGIIYKFGASWCGPCQRVAPLVAKLEREGLPVKSVDIDQQKELANQFRVDRVPTFVLVVDGKEVDRVVGLMTEAELRQMAARIPTGNPPAIAQPSTSPVPPPGPFEISLGEAAPIRRPAEQPLKQEPVAPAAEPRSGLAGLWPFGREPEAQPTIRGNDSTVGTTAENVGESSPGTAPMAASIRIRVRIGDKMNLGSGTIVSSRQGHTLIMTCGHIFRNFTAEGKIEVDAFHDGQSKLFLAKLEKFDLESDVGLISIPTDQPLPQVPVARRDAAPADGAQVACIGCSGGENPSREQLRVTAIDRYEGPHNIECTGVPVRGRSGGGLFNQRGELIGICIAADTQGQRGLYAGLFAVHKLLDECSLTALYEPVSTPPAATPASHPAAPELLANTGAAGFPERPVTPAASNAFNSMPPMTSEPAATANPLDVAAGSAEVVVIIRDPNRPGAPNRVVIIHEASPAFLKYLNGELSPGELPADAAFGRHAQPQREQLVPAMEHRQAPQWPAVHEVERQLRSSTSDVIPVRTAKSALEPTSLARPVQPQRYVRTATR